MCHHLAPASAFLSSKLPARQAGREGTLSSCLQRKLLRVTQEGAVTYRSIQSAQSLPCICLLGLLLIFDKHRVAAVYRASLQGWWEVAGKKHHACRSLPGLLPWLTLKPSTVHCTFLLFPSILPFFSSFVSFLFLFLSYWVKEGGSQFTATAVSSFSFFPS